MFLLRFISVRKLDKCQLIIFGEEVESDQRARPPTPRGQANQNSWSDVELFFSMSFLCILYMVKINRTKTTK